jgi:hypothetical protein
LRSKTGEGASNPPPQDHQYSHRDRPDHENGRDAADLRPALPVNCVSPLLFANPQNHDNNAVVDANAIAAALFFDWCLGRRR